ncbi:spondin domain-containing protein [Alteromonas sp. a30]|uniref:spondin domain-containing protein n=1 Tax=Alteromonas sp. a30 TaxID=2730917 RepID=UPI0022830C62|nr:spondin domain-containing protein [Alteromonas sp. a30]MCY7296930.1 hypothetical protein [Alteromonas sp. a30]
MKKLNALFAAGILGLSAQAQAAELEVHVQNLTQGIYFTPILVAAHPADASLFELGMPASMELQAMAEGGSIAGLETVVDSVGGEVGVQEAENGLTAPATARMFTLNSSDTNTVLSVTAMMLPTNDGFIGLDNWTIPTEAGTYTVYLNAYDAGTEANDEIRGSGAPGEAGMPVPPPLDPLLGMNGTGVTTEEVNTTVHVHRGNLGDAAQDGGASDVSNTVQRWLNPVAKVTVIVK